ncbi:[protein-PII] uridylyltransferase [Propionivibrio limicola]|uniref:[protein-PII] uridylyltransferase n=1 Tax=Propionivibrio limicola TaxID=167645 RepID=UPI0012916696|nr:[protein-PII] uridylyltransferase [Propionivibrio limicola]
MILDTAERIDLLSRYRSRLQTGQTALRERYLAEPDASRLLYERSHLIDGVLRDLWKELKFPEDLALVAVGGYGRGELWPASDIDLLILLPETPDATLATQLEQLVGLFWDIGLDIGHSVRTLDECLAEAAADLTVQTALVEARLLVGDYGLFTRFYSEFRLRLDPQTFYRTKRSEQDERYLKYQESPYSLEPNCKESPGGLRDLQTILWIAQVAGYGNSWRDLKRHGFITHQEEQGLERREKFLQRLRIQLHLLAGRHEDRLLFDFQTALAEQMGFKATPTRRASEQLMQEYYRNAKTIMQLNTILLQNMGAAIFPSNKQPPIPINERFQNAHQLLDVTHENVFHETPGAMLEAFLVMQQHPELKGLTARTIRTLWRARTAIDDDFRNDPVNKARFIELFKQPRGVLHELRRMNQFDILGRYLPNFGEIVGQMQHDLFHVYTVDQHSMQVLRNLRRFSETEFAHEYPFCSQLISEFERPWVLYIAALFHDIAKGRGGSHSELGAVDAKEFCDSHGLAEEDSELIVWLVRQHLVMSAVAQKQDTSDPDVVAAFAAIVGDERHLTALYLLTVADIRGTSPKVWNSWKGQLLEDLFRQTRRLLQSGGKAPVRHGIIQERQEEALRLIRYYGIHESGHENLWRQLDTVYFLRHSPEDIAWHARALHYRVDAEQPVVKARLNPHGDGIEVMVYTRDQSYLFARLVGFFSRAGYNIMDAKIHTTRHGYALDSFMLLDVSGRDSDRSMISYIEHELEDRLTKQAAPEAPSNGRISRQVKHFPIQPQVNIQPDDKGTYYILSVSAADRPGLLYTVAMALADYGADLHTAKIATLGERVEDTFLITGNNLEESAARVKLETHLLNQLEH